MKSYRKTSDLFSFSATHKRTVEEYSDRDPESDPTPSFPALRVVTVDGETIEESTRPLAKCRQVTPFAASLKRLRLA